jgi:hypothetical protein
MKRASHPLAVVVRLVVSLGVTLLVGAISGALAWSSLLSYEDVFSVVHSGAFVQFGATALQKVVGVPDNLPLGARVLLFGTGALQKVVGARTVVAFWLAGTTALGAGAYSVTRAMCRDFDVGRRRRPPDASLSWRPALPISTPRGQPAARRGPLVSTRATASRLGRQSGRIRADRSQDWIPAVRDVDHP